MLSYRQTRWLQWLEGVLDDPGNGGYEVETLRAESVAEINRRDFLGVDSDEVVPTYYLTYRVVGDVDPAEDWPLPAGCGWRVHDKDGQIVYPCRWGCMGIYIGTDAACADGCGGQGPFCHVDLQGIPCDDAGLCEVRDRLGEGVAPTVIQLIWKGQVEDLDSEEEWIENHGLPAEHRETERRLQAVLDHLPTSIPDVQRPCDRPGCTGTYVLVYRDGRPDVHLDIDGSAEAGLVCDRGCGFSSCHFWCWDPAPGQEVG